MTKKQSKSSRKRNKVKNEVRRSSRGNRRDVDFHELLGQAIVEDKTPETPFVAKGQYKEAMELLEDAEACQLTPMLIGPPGTGKTMLARSYAATRNKDFEWLTLDESTKPVHLTGGYDPAETIKRGFVREAFVPGPLTKMMVSGGIFLANELNRATEYTQNSFLEPLEERSLVIPRLGRIRADSEFFMICAANPNDMAGTHRISEALKDRIKVWIRLDYPSRSVEMEIIRKNIPQVRLSRDQLDLTYQLIRATRTDREVERPASIRSAIAIAKLVGRKVARGDDVNTHEFRKIATRVLQGGIKTRPGSDETRVIDRIVKSVLK